MTKVSGTRIKKKIKGDKFKTEKHASIYHCNFFLRFGKKKAWLCNPWWDILVLLVKSNTLQPQGRVWITSSSGPLSGCVSFKLSELWSPPLSSEDDKSTY